MFQRTPGRVARRIFVSAVAGVAVTLSALAQSASPAERSSVAFASPVPERLAAGEAWRTAEELAAGTSDCEVLVGSGDSMLPLYPDRTLLVVRRVPMSELRRGMTVVFIGDRGRPVAHALLEKTPSGWIARGLANASADRTLVRAQNYLGAVVRAFTPVLGAESNPAAASEAVPASQ